MDSLNVDIALYLIGVGMLQSLCALLLSPLYFFLARRFGFRRHLLATYVAFNVFLLFWGCLGNCVFTLLTYGKLYTSVDRMVDCYPFIPFGQWVLDQGFGGDLHGHLIGNATLDQLRLIWLAVTVPVWLLTFVSTVLMERLNLLVILGFVEAEGEVQPDAR